MCFVVYLYQRRIYMSKAKQYRWVLFEGVPDNRRSQFRGLLCSLIKQHPDLFGIIRVEYTETCDILLMRANNSSISAILLPFLLQALNGRFGYQFNSKEKDEGLVYRLCK